MRVAVVAGSGPVFATGWGEDVGGGQGNVPVDGPAAFGGLARLPIPTICAINGDCFSAGLEVALACDLRIAAGGARFGFPEIAQGLIPRGGGTQRLPRAVGRSWAAWLLLTGETIDAQKALAIGLVNRVVPAAALEDEANALAKRIAGQAPLAVRFAKEAALAALEMPLEQGLRYELDLAVLLQTTEDRAEGVQAFLEKRPPRFEGK